MVMFTVVAVSVSIIAFFVISLILCISDGRRAKKENRKRNEGLVVLTAISSALLALLIACGIVIALLIMLIDSFMRSM